MNLVLIVKWVLWAIETSDQLTVRKGGWHESTANADAQLVKQVYLLGSFLDQIKVYHFFICRIQSIVQVTHYKVIITCQIWVQILSLVFQRLDDFFHHIISSRPGLLPMHQMASKHIECHIVELKVNLDSTFVRKFDVADEATCFAVRGYSAID